MTDALLDDAERDAIAKVGVAHVAILGLGLDVNHDELTAAVHVLQSFIIQRALHRHYPDEFSDWFEGKRRTRI